MKDQNGSVGCREPVPQHCMQVLPDSFQLPERGRFSSSFEDTLEIVLVKITLCNELLDQFLLQ